MKPTTPSNLTGVTSPGQVVLSWTGSTDNVGVTGYRIYRSGTQVGSVLGAITTFTHTGLTAGVSSYTVRAIDAAGNLSDASNTVTVTVPDSVKPSIPANLRATVGTGQVVLNWNASTDNVGVTGYRIYRGGTEIASVAGNVLTYTNTGVAGPVSYTVRAFDAAGNLSDASNTASVTVPDSIKPTVPGSLTATAGTGQIVLNWTASTDNAGVTGYRVYRSGTQVGSVNGTTLTYTHTGLAPGTHSYTVRAIDAAGNLSDPSNTATATLADTQAPTAPGSLAATAASPTRVNLSWTASTDNVGVTTYEVYRNGLLLAGPGNVTSYADTTTVASTAYQYTVKAVDAAGNRSSASNTVNVTTPATGPVTPGSKTFSPSADARVQEANPTTNYGTGQYLRTIGGANDLDMESYLKFDVSGLGGPVKTAVLRMVPTGFSWDGPGVRSAGSNWTETGDQLVQPPGSRLERCRGQGNPVAARRLRREVAGDRQRNGLVRADRDHGLRVRVRLARVVGPDGPAAADRDVLMRQTVAGGPRDPGGGTCGQATAEGLGSAPGKRNESHSHRARPAPAEQRRGDHEPIADRVLRRALLHHLELTHDQAGTRQYPSSRPSLGPARLVSAPA